jgi:Tfp pilus assembly protein PilF
MGQPQLIDRRLESWKEIAAFFGRDERTVRRWEKESALPVHRVPGGAKGRIFAYESELRLWLKTPRAVPDATVAAAPAIEPGLPVRFRFSPAGRWALGLALVALVAVGVAYRSGHRFAVQASPELRNQKRAATPEAQDLYLQGRFYWSKRTPEDLNKAVDFFTQSIVHDPSYAPAYVGLADSYNLLREYSAMPASEAYPRALAAAKKAVELDDNSSEAHASLAFVSFFGMWDFADGEREFRRAIALDPNNARAHHWSANALLALHRLPEALAEIEHAQALDPSSGSILADKGNILFVGGREDEGIALVEAIAKHDPAFRSPHRYLRDFYFRNQDYPRFLNELRSDAVAAHDDAALAVANAADQGFATHAADGMLTEMLQAQEKLYAQQLVGPTDLARTLTALGRKSEALRYLDLAYQQRDGALLFIEAFREFKPLHPEPAYRDILARMNLPPQS